MQILMFVPILKNLASSFSSSSGKIYPLVHIQKYHFQVTRKTDASTQSKEPRKLFRLFWILFFFFFCSVLLRHYFASIKRINDDELSKIR